MSVHLYEDNALTQQVSEGDLSNPDDDIYNGTDGESKDKELYLANEQSALAAPLASGETSLQLDQPRFANNEVIIIGTEQMRIQAGGGTTTLGVERGYGATTPAAHAAGIEIRPVTGYVQKVIRYRFFDKPTATSTFTGIQYYRPGKEAVVEHPSAECLIEVLRNRCAIERKRRLVNH